MTRITEQFPAMDHKGRTTNHLRLLYPQHVRYD